MIFLDTNILSEVMKREPDAFVLQWLAKNDATLAISSIVIAELSAGIYSLHVAQRSPHLSEALMDWSARFTDRTYPVTLDVALLAGEMIGHAKLRGRPLQMADALIAAVAKLHGAPLATRNRSDFELLGIELIDPWMPPN